MPQRACNALVNAAIDVLPMCSHRSADKDRTGAVHARVVQRHLDDVRLRLGDVHIRRGRHGCRCRQNNLQAKRFDAFQ